MIESIISLLLVAQIEHTASVPKVWVDIWINPGAYDLHSPTTLLIERQDGLVPTKEDIQGAFEMVRTAK